jgi:hypothetical protein
LKADTCAENPCVAGSIPALPNRAKTPDFQGFLHFWNDSKNGVFLVRAAIDPAGVGHLCRDHRRLAFG